MSNVNFAIPEPSSDDEVAGVPDEPMLLALRSRCTLQIAAHFGSDLVAKLTILFERL